jgi:succinoglycan biosynthesis transport protein ExoP
MPQYEKPQFASADGVEFSTPTTLGERIDFVIGFLRRRYLSIIICAVLALPLGALYLLTTPSLYIASATMMIETRQSPLQESLLGNAPADPGWIESQIGVLKSQNVAAYVVKQLRLADHPQFTRPDRDVIDKILARIGWDTSEPALSEAERVGAALGAVRGGLDVRRIGQSYMLQISFRSRDAELALKVANAITDAYIYDQLNAKYQANRRAGDWLQERLQTLREQASVAERAVIEFKSKNNIVAAGGTLMNEKQLSEISGQLATARAQAADLQARLDRIEAVRRQYQPDQPATVVDEWVSEAMSNGIINGLRTRYLELANRESDWAVRYGPNHVAVVNLRNQIRDIRKSILSELGRIEETYKSEYTIAKKRQDEMEKRLTALISQSTETNQAQVVLFSLEAAAQSYRKLYDSFLQRHTEMVQQQSFPISNARTLSSASVSQSGPRSLKVWMLTILAGGMVGVGFGALREIMDRGFRTREQVRSVLDTECLALIPRIVDSRSKRFLLPMLVGEGFKRPFRDSLPIAMGGRREEAVAAPAVHTQASPKSGFSASAVLRAVVDGPTSPFAEAIQSMKLTVDLASQPTSTKVIGLTSCLPHEGKSTVATGLAAHIAQDGARVILVDCDVRNPSLTRALAPDARVGLLDVVARTVSFTEAVRRYPTSRIAFLPTVVRPNKPNPIDILASDATKSLFQALQVQYDCVIVDLSPLASASDVRATTRFINSYILVIEWGVTKVEAVQYALRHAPDVHERIVGTVLNKVDMNAMGRYDTYGAQYYYSGYGSHPRS